MNEPTSVTAQRLIVVGACDGLGESLVRALMGDHAQVVAMDADARGLARLQGPDAARVPTLPLKGPPAGALGRIGNAWGDAPLHGVINLMPLRSPGELDLNLSVLRAIAGGFYAALRAHRAQVITVVARPANPSQLAQAGLLPMILQAQDTLAHDHDTHRFNTVSLPKGDTSAAHPTVMALLRGQAGPLSGAHLRL
ncbi:hypothetical protein [Sulfitobacter sp. S190]|uniref:hypothetical protein n=1 Tax=Sulfitobacter sp. S190 TaxID=2867022 RepID=UPI0021A28DC1|nr:hypothetical protein [Sulfitobacter sp. S190]UWR23798.1 hypothetical protein K3756_07510 [Sulfitobacter sp. S190]